MLCEIIRAVAIHPSAGLTGGFLISQAREHLYSLSFFFFFFYFKCLFSAILNFTTTTSVGRNDWSVCSMRFFKGFCGLGLWNRVGRFVTSGSQVSLPLSLRTVAFLVCVMHFLYVCLFFFSRLFSPKGDSRSTFHGRAEVCFVAWTADADTKVWGFRLPIVWATDLCSCAIRLIVRVCVCVRRWLQHCIAVSLLLPSYLPFQLNVVICI